MSRIDISQVIDNSRVGAFQVLVFALCGACLVMDGFDVQALSFASPAILGEWGLPAPRMGVVFAAGNFGVLIGSVLFTMAADRIGRRPVLIFATFFYAIMTWVTTLASNIDTLFYIRLIAGIGLGSIMPNATALIGEYSPRRSRVTLMMCISSGFTAGGMIAGFVAAWLIPAYGWRSVFYFGSAIPLVIAVLMIPWLPESLQFLAVRKTGSGKIGAWLKRIDPDSVKPGAEYVAQEEATREGIPAGHLFREGRGSGTLLLWAVNFLNLFNLYFLTQWMATVLREAGYAPSTYIIVSNTLLVGGTLGSFGMAWLIAKYRAIPVLAVSFALACISIAVIGQLIERPALPILLLTASMFVAGWCVIGGQPGLNAIAAMYYPTYLRSTGIGWGLGVGRLGAILGPYVGGMLLGLKWMPGPLFLTAAIPALLSSVVMAVIARRSTIAQNR